MQHALNFCAFCSMKGILSYLLFSGPHFSSEVLVDRDATISQKTYRIFLVMDC